MNYQELLLFRFQHLRYILRDRLNKYPYSFTYFTSPFKNQVVVRLSYVKANNICFFTDPVEEQ